jgi:hypothetical protein
VLMPWLDMLQRSATTGHDVVAFVLSLVLHRSNSGASNDNIAQQWLRKVEGDEAGLTANVTWKNEICTRRLQQAMFVLEDLARQLAPGQSSPLPPLAMSVRRQDGHQCGGGGCDVHAGWKGWGSGLCSAMRSVGSAMSVIGSSDQCGRFYADQC